MKSIQLDKLNVAFVDQGEGSPIVFLHGFPLDHSMWDAQINDFSQTHRTIVPDLRGHGGTTVSEGTVTMAEMAEDLTKLLDALEVTEPIVLCGLSMGGYVAWEFWRQQSTRLSRLILCDTRAVADTEEVARGREMMAAQVVDAGAKMASESMLPKLFGEATYAKQPNLVEAIRETILGTDPRAIAATQRGMAERRDMTLQLDQIDVPTLVLCGAEDKISTPEEMRQIADSMPRADFVQIENAGHLAPLENPTATNFAIRRFLATQ